MKKLIFGSCLALAALFMNGSCSVAENGSVAGGEADVYRITIDGEIKKGSLSVDKRLAKKGDLVIITAAPDALTQDEEQEQDGRPWRVESIKATYGEGMNLRGITKKEFNTYKFRMPAGDVKLSATFTRDEDSDNADIRGVYASAGSVIKIDDDYKIDIPYGAGTVYISAECEEINATLMLTSDAGNIEILGGEDVEDDENLLDRYITVPEGVSEFKLTVTSANEKVKNKCAIYVSQWPDLSLESLTVSNDATSFLRELDPVAERQAVNVPLRAEGARTFTITPVPAGDESFSWKVTPGIVNITEVLKVFSGKATVCRTIGIEKYSKDYNVDLVMSDDVNFPVEPLASGGYVNFVKDNGNYYEIHKFTKVGDSEELKFFEKAPKDLTARVLVVAGGGGSGGAGYPSWGGGAGGMVENDGYSLTLTSYAIKVGSGGAGGAGGIGTADTEPNRFLAGKNGGDSQFGDDIIAYGGGGGCGRPGVDRFNYGGIGGSSGGYAISGETKPGIGGDSYGNIGGVYTDLGQNTGGGGGGAGGPGVTVNVYNNDGKNTGGGPGRVNNITGVDVSYAAGGNTASGSGGRGNTPQNGEPNTGNGGQGAWNNSKGADGGSGIVIVRFQYTPPAGIPNVGQ